MFSGIHFGEGVFCRDPRQPRPPGRQGSVQVPEEGGGQVPPGPHQLWLREEAGQGHQPGDLRSQDHSRSRAAQEGREKEAGGSDSRPQKSFLRIQVSK